MFSKLFLTLVLLFEMPLFAQDQRSSDIAIVKHYETGMRYITGNPRTRFPAEMFIDIPVGGTGKLRLAYFGARSQTLEAQQSEFVEIKWYSWDSPEGQHARLFDVQSLGVDGLGRKITRYAMDHQSALNSLKTGELEPLKRYLAAKKRLIQED